MAPPPPKDKEASGSESSTPARRSSRRTAARQQEAEESKQDTTSNNNNKSRSGRKRKTSTEEESVTSTASSRTTNKRARKTKATAAEESSEAVLPRSIPAIDNLRIPAQQTPGRARGTQRLRPAAEEEETNQQPNKANEIARPPTANNSHRLNFGNEYVPGNGANVAAEASAHPLLASPETQSGQAPVVIHTEAVAFRARHTRTASKNIDLVTTFTAFEEVMVQNEGPAAELQHPLLQEAAPTVLVWKRYQKYPLFWVGLLVILHTLALPWILSPLLSTMAHVSDSLVNTYSSLVSPNHGRHPGLMKKLHQLATVQDELESTLKAMRDATEQLQTWYQVSRTAMTEHETAVQEATDQVSGIQSRLLVDVSFLDTWDIPNPTVSCQTNASMSSQPSMEHIEQQVQQLQQQAMESAKTILSNDFVTVIEGWVKDDLSESMADFDTSDVATAANQALQSSSSQQSPQQLIQWITERLELERADQTGRVDFASVVNGASVIRTGKWATSPSLKDSLPVLNRMADVLGLRFYGHGPEVALTPTGPPMTALGQCWAFEPSGTMSNYGVLSFRLGTPIHVDTISIEHPPKEVTDRVDTAIRSFRVYGFEDTSAQGEPWNLGTFEYSINGAIRQEYKAAQVVNERKVPVLASMAIAIDSNWGSEYACLYRVRVLGEQS